MKVLIKNILELQFVNENGIDSIIENAFLGIENGKLIAFGEMINWGGITDWSNLKVIDAENRIVSSNKSNLIEGAQIQFSISIEHSEKEDYKLP